MNEVTIEPSDAPPKTGSPPKYNWDSIREAAIAHRVRWLAEETDKEWLRVTVPGGFTAAIVGSVQDGRNAYIDPKIFDVRSEGTYYNEEGSRRCNMFIRQRSTEEIQKREKESK